MCELWKANSWAVGELTLCGVCYRTFTGSEYSLKTYCVPGTVRPRKRGLNHALCLLKGCGWLGYPECNKYVLDSALLVEETEGPKGARGQ